MKKRLFALFLAGVLALGLAAQTAFAADGAPDGWWPVWSAYTAAVESGNDTEIVAKGDEVIRLYTSVPRNITVANGLYMVYFTRFTRQIFEKQSQYAAAEENTRNLMEISEYLTKNGVDRTDAIRTCQAHLDVVTTRAEVYAASYTQNNSYGSKIAAGSGAFYGTIGEGVYSDRSITSFYIELDSENAATFSYMINPKADGSRVILINLNFQKEGDTARAVPSGAYDANLKKTLNYLSTLKCPVLMRIGGEMDVWTNSVTPAEFIAAYQYIGRMARTLAPAVELVWSPNYGSAWNVDVADYYPDSSLVDWIGLSLYYNYTATNASQEWLEYSHGMQFADPIANARKIAEFAKAQNKPMIATEGGTTKANGEPYAAEKVAKEFSTLTMVYPQCKALVYFDKTINGNDYRITGSVRTAADAAIASNPTLIAPGSGSAATYIPLKKFNESVADTMVIGATGSTYYDTDMAVTYRLDDKQVAACTGSPNQCVLHLDELAYGKHKFEAIFRDDKGYTLTKTYTLDYSSAGSMMASEGWKTDYAKSSTQTITLNGQKTTLATYQVINANGDGTNYVRLRDIADMLDGTAAQFNVDWDNATSSILIRCRSPYTTRNGSEGVVPFTDPKTYILLSSPVLVDGVMEKMGGIILLDDHGGGHTYFKLRDLGAVCGFHVDWTLADGIIITT